MKKFLALVALLAAGSVVAEEVCAEKCDKEKCEDAALTENKDAQDLLLSAVHKAVHNLEEAAVEGKKLENGLKVADAQDSLTAPKVAEEEVAA